MSAEAAAYNKLDGVHKDYFKELQTAPFSEQAMAFLDAYWEEIGSQAPFVFECAWEVAKSVDMQMQKCTYLHLYKESSQLNDFDWALLFFERLCKAVETQLTEDRDASGEIVMNGDKPVMKKWSEIDFYSISMPTMMTAINRKKELKEKVDFTQDGKISFIEYLIYQYKQYSNASDFIIKGRAIKEGTRMDSPERKQLQLAEQALANVRNKIAEYQAAMQKQQEIIDDHDNNVLDEAGKQKVGRARRGKALVELNELKNSGLANELKKALIDAEYKVKVAMKMMQDAMAANVGSTGIANRQGALAPGKMYWIDASVKAEKKKATGYGLKGLVAKN